MTVSQRLGIKFGHNVGECLIQYTCIYLSPGLDATLEMLGFLPSSFLRNYSLYPNLNPHVTWICDSSEKVNQTDSPRMMINLPW